MDLPQTPLWSRFWFSWMRPLVDLGSDRPIEFTDLPRLETKDRSMDAKRHIDALWDHEKRTCSNPSLARALMKDYLRSTWSSRLLIIANSLSKIGQAVFLGFLLEKLEQGKLKEAYLWAMMICICGVIAFPTKQHSFFQLYRKGAQYRTGLTATIFAKTLRLPSLGKSKEGGFESIGAIANLASNDVERFLLTSIYTNLFVASPVEMLVVLGIGIRTIGSVFCYGFLLLLVLVPFQLFLSRRFANFRQRIAHFTDKRVSFISQVIIGCRVMKLQGWELEFEKRIALLRSEEIKQLRHTYCLRAWNDVIYYTSSLVVAVFVFALHVGVNGNSLTPQIVFTSFTLWNLLQYSMTKHIPNAVMGLSECYVACLRIQSFLELSEYNFSNHQKLLKTNLDESQSISQDQALLMWTKATFFWDEEKSKTALDSVSLKLYPAKLYCVVGGVGSGKSALLQGIIGEMHGGTENASSYPFIGYAAQNPWIMHGTARENIVMGLPFDEQWYEKVVVACCLKPDFAALIHGDQTLLGDRGLQCSGGQKARLALARVLYSDPDMILLDDPLSAVDSAVANTLFNEAVIGLCVARGKCVVLVTHHYHLVAGECIVMKDGRILEIVSSNRYKEKKANDNLKASYVDDANAFNDRNNDRMLSSCHMHGVGGSTPIALDAMNHDSHAAKSESHIAKLPSKKSKPAPINIEETPSFMKASFQEKRETGKIKNRTWLSYMNAIGGWRNCACLLILFIVTQVLFLFSLTYVGKWAEEPSDEQGKLHWYLLVFASIAATIFVATVRAQLSFHCFLGASRSLHNSMLHSVLRANIEFFDTNPVGRILNRFASDVGIIDELLPFTFYDFGVGLVMFLGSIATAMAVLPIVVLVFPFLLVAFLRLRRLFVETTRELKRLEGLGKSPLHATFSEALNGISTLRANDKIGYFSDKFEAMHDSLVQTQFSFIVVSRWFATKLDFLSFLFLCTASMGAVIIQDFGWPNIDPAAVGLALSLLLQLAGANFPYMVRQSAEVTNHMVSVERVWEFGHELPQEAALVTDTDDLNETWPEYPSIKVEDISCSYRSDLPFCLKNISFDILPGERVGIVGRTGAGKSSLLQALVRLLETQSGTITIDGIDISLLGLHKLRRNMAVITQSPVLFSDLSILENLDPYLNASKETANSKFEEILRSTHLWQTIQRIPGGLYGHLGECGSVLSVGQRQLFCLARALLSECKLLILDEATANVDKTTDVLIQQTLRQQFGRCTVVAIAHRLETIIDYDKILVLNDGKIEEFGTPSDLLQNPNGLFVAMVESAGKSSSTTLKRRVKATDYVRTDS